MPLWLQITLPVLSALLASLGVMLNYSAVVHRRQQIIDTLCQDVAVLKSRLDTFSRVLEQWLLAHVHSPGHPQRDLLLEQFTAQMPMTLADLDLLDVLLEQAQYEPEDRPGQYLAFGLMLACVRQRKVLYDQLFLPQEAESVPWWRRYWHWWQAWWH